MALGFSLQRGNNHLSIGATVGCSVNAAFLPKLLKRSLATAAPFLPFLSCASRASLQQKL